MPPDEQVTDNQDLITSAAPTPGEEFGSGGEILGESASAGSADAGSDPLGGQPQPATPQGQVPPGQSDQGLLTVADAIRRLGLGDTLGDALNQGDYSALQALAERAKQAEALQRQIQQQSFYANLGQRLAPHADKLQAYLNQQAAPAAPQRQPWEPPLDPSTVEKYMNYVEKDPNTGLFVAKPGADPSIAKSVNEYQEYVNGFISNPSKMITQAAEHIAQKTFDERFEQRYQQMQQQQQVNAILQQNAQWMYQRNPDGSVARQGNGQQMYSPEGAAYVRHLQTLSSAGVTDPAIKNDLAIKMVQADFYAYQQAQAQAQQRVAPAQQQALAGSPTPSRNPLQSLPATERLQTPGATEPNTEGLSFREAAMQAMKLQGISDDDFTPEAFSG